MISNSEVLWNIVSKPVKLEKFCHVEIEIKEIVQKTPIMLKSYTWNFLYVIWCLPVI